MVNIIILSVVLVLLIGALIYFFVNRKKIKVKLLEEEAAKGNPATLLALGLMFYSGVKIDEDREKGIKYIKQAAELGNAQAQYLYSGIILRKDLGVLKSAPMATLFVWRIVYVKDLLSGRL